VNNVRIKEQLFMTVALFTSIQKKVRNNGGFFYQYQKHLLKDRIK